MTDKLPHERWPNIWAIGRYKGKLRQAMFDDTWASLLDAIEQQLVLKQSQIDQLAGFKHGVLEERELER